MAIGCTLTELGRRMSSHEFSLWFALWLQEPAAMRADIRAGIVASTVANYAGRVRGEHELPARPRDFLTFVPANEARPPEPDPLQHFKGI